MTNLRKFIATNLIVIVFFAIVSYAGYLAFYPVSIYDRTAERFQVLTPQVNQGGNVKYVVEFCKVHPGVVDTTTTLVNSTLHVVRSSKSGLGKGCYSFIQSAYIPEYITPGQYHIEIAEEESVNVLRTERTLFTTESFEILPRGAPITQAEIKPRDPAFEINNNRELPNLNPEPIEGSSVTEREIDND